MLPTAALSVTLPEPALMKPEPERDPVTRFNDRLPLLVVTLLPTTRLLASVTVSEFPAPVTLATSVATFVLMVVALAAVTLSTFAAIWPVPVVPTPPVLIVTLFTPPPALTVPLMFRPPVALEKEMSPLLVTMLATLSVPVHDVMLRPLPAPVTLAERMLLVSPVAFGALRAVQSRVFAVTAPVPRIAPLATLIVTFEAPAAATIVPVRVRLPESSVSEALPVVVTLAGSMTRLFVSVTVRPPLVMLAVRLVTLVLIAESVFALTFRTLPLTCPAEELSVMLPWLALSVTFAVPAAPAVLMKPGPLRLPVTRLTETRPLLVVTLVVLLVPTWRSLDSVTVSV